MMTETEIKQQIVKAIREITRNKDREITEDTKLIADLGLESIDFVDLIFECERRTGVEIELSQFAILAGEEGKQGYQDITLKEIMNIVSELMKRREGNPTPS